MSYGVTEDGFQKKNLTEILAEIEADERAAISAKLNLLDTAVLGQLNGIFADKLRELWDVAEAVYRSQYPDSAAAEALDQVASITGAIRLPATKSQVTLDQLFLDDGVALPAGRVVSVGLIGARFATLTEVSNSSGAPSTFSAEAESEELGPVQGLAGQIDTIQTPVTGWSAAAALTCDNAETYDLDDGMTLEVQIDGGATQIAIFNTGDFVDIDVATAAEVAAVIDADILGGTAYDANGYVRGASETEGTGSSFQVVGGTANAVLGFSTDLIKGFNSEDVVLGRDTELDPMFRIRRDELLRIIGAATLEAIRAAVRELDGVLQAFVFENVTMVTDGNGLPPKSFEVVVSGGDDQEIADKIFEVKAVGIETHGDVTKQVLDSMGFSHDVKFSRPTPVPIYLELTVVTNSALFPLDGEDQIKVALKAFGDLLQIGDDVIALQFKCVPLSVAGVDDVTVFKIDDVYPPTGTGNIPVALRDLATFDTSDIDVTVT